MDSGTAPPPSARSRAIDTPIGTLVVSVDETERPGGAVTEVSLPSAQRARPRGRVTSPLLDEVERQLEDWFAGRRQDFDLPLAPRGTEFQRAVWQALLEVPFGGTCSYVDIARAVGRPTASRAVGAANGRNPIAIVIPCHRIVGADGSLTGYGGGLQTKRWLLDFESEATGLFARR